ncbi:MAG: hypothetical protein GSR86_01930, partial [Desulfurococcales archaeon]|nr:hypothetical protein [Desulfurococcales archaeon]
MSITFHVLPVRANVSRKRLKEGIKEYITYRINLPASVASNLGLTGGDAILLVALKHPRWFHIFDWGSPEVLEEVLPRLTERERLELCATLAPESVCNGRKPHILVADPDRLKSLGLDPEKPITLEDLEEA